MTIAGKRILVTGANRGIGQALVNEATGTFSSLQASSSSAR
jgi:NAD(P)-dependent dehydrogenase (short-subunit alcohol dehydrogenase family)